LKRVRDYSDVKGTGIIDIETAQAALQLLDVDKEGFDSIDNKILTAIIDNFNGGPVGLETLSYFIGEELDTIQDVYEPYLLQKGFIIRTPRGRVASDSAYKHLNRIKKSDKRTVEQSSIFEKEDN
jgi:Holliday junction DNA helicase RuvB